MGDDKKQDSADQADNQETSEAERSEASKQGSGDAAAPADDDIIIK